MKIARQTNVFPYLKIIKVQKEKLRRKNRARKTYLYLSPKLILMTNSSQANESGIGVKPDDAEKTESEKPKEAGEKKERINEEVKSILLFAATSIAAGYVSFILTPAKPAFIPTTSLLIALAATAAIFLGTKTIVQKLEGKKDMQWIMGNGGAIYLFLWFVTWIIFYNAM